VPPTVSVLMTVFNGEAFLRQAIDSVLAQTYDDWELIVVDDASVDSTPEILMTYRDPRVGCCVKNGTASRRFVPISRFQSQRPIHGTSGC